MNNQMSWGSTFWQRTQKNTSVPPAHATASVLTGPTKVSVMLWLRVILDFQGPSSKLRSNVQYSRKG